MRPVAILLLLCGIATAGATRTPPSTALAFAQFAEQPPSGQAPNIPTVNGLGSSEIDLVKWAVTQGGLTLVLIVVLVSYRRDFFRKNATTQASLDAVREEKLALGAIVDRHATATTAFAVAVAANTKATDLLAANVNDLDERRRTRR